MHLDQGNDWLALTQEVPVDSARRIIDAHHHLWGDGQGLHSATAYLSEHLIADMGGHNVVGSIYVECDVAYRQDGPEHLRPVGETEFAAEQARQSAATRAPIRAIVSYADLTLGDAVQDVLDAHADAGRGLFRGIRQLPGGGGRPSRNLLAEPAFAEGVARLGRNGFSLDAFAMFTQHSLLAKLTRAVPETTFILNHLGTPMYRPGDTSRDAIMTVWREGIRELANCPNVFVKIGGIGIDHMFGMGWSRQERPPTSDEVVAWWGDDIRFCIDTIGPHRCLFESNFPVDRQCMSYTVLWNAFQKIAEPYSESEQVALFAETAEKAYKLDIA